MFILTLALAFLDILLEAIAMLGWRLPETALEGGPFFSWSIHQDYMHLFILCDFFDELAVILASVALIGLATGIRVVHAGRKLPVDRVLRQASYAIAVLFGALDAVIAGLNEDQYNTPPSFTNNTPKMLTIIIVVVIQFLFAFALLLWSIFVAGHTKSEPKVKTATRYLLVCCVLLLVRASYGLVAILSFQTGVFYFPMQEPFVSMGWAVMLFVTLRFWPVCSPCPPIHPRDQKAAGALG